jgi:hypothetical protein
VAGSGAFVERRITLAAVSTDDPDDSRDFAKRYGIEFPLISDVGGEISKAFVGIDTADVTIPGVVVIKRDGSIVFRQVATSKDDRLTAKQLLDAVDRTLGTKGSYVESFRPALARMQLRSEVGVGQIRYPATSFTGFASNGSVVVPLNRYLIAGAGIRAVDVNMNLSGSLGLRVPFLHDIAALELSAESGLPVLGEVGVYAGVRAGLWYASSPRFAFTLAATFGAYDAGAVEQLPGWTATFGVALLLDR